MNWGYKIGIVYGVFVAGISLLVLKSSSQKMDLVTTDYYAKELKYQEKIDETKRANALSEEISCEIKDSQVVLYFPKDFAGKTISGKAELYCPSDEGKDVAKEFSIHDGVLIVNTSKSNKGQYELHISWQVEGVHYYFEKKIFI